MKRTISILVGSLALMVGATASAQYEDPYSSSSSSSGGSPSGLSLGGGIGVATGAGLTGFDLGLRADYEVVPHLAPGFFFDFMTDADNTAVDVGLRMLGTGRVPGADKVKFYGGIGMGYAHFPGDVDDFDLQLVTGVGYRATDHLEIRSDIGYNFLLSEGAFFFNWLPISLQYAF